MIKRLSVYTTFKKHGANMFHLIIVHGECLLRLASSFDMNVYHIVRVNRRNAVVWLRMYIKFKDGYYLVKTLYFILAKKRN